ncbi:putative chorismate pyruvate-lyase [Gammaproteobacteria bacterium]|nr:putative chorismate pyruvate-lyase [Gammaproteobacteria bacterium]
MIRAPIKNIQADWLNRQGSLVKHLQQLGAVTVHVADEYQGQANKSEANYLGINYLDATWNRVVILKVDDQELVIAHSIIKLNDSFGTWAAIRSLQSRPLAEILYQDTLITRSKFMQCKIDKTDDDAGDTAVLYALAFNINAYDPACLELCARYSIFYRTQAPLLLIECFLPEFWDKILKLQH